MFLMKSSSSNKQMIVVDNKSVKKVLMKSMNILTLWLCPWTQRYVFSYQDSHTKGKKKINVHDQKVKFHKLVSKQKWKSLAF